MLRMSRQHELADLRVCRNCAEPLPGKVVHRAWIEVSPNSKWTGAYRLVMTNSGPAVAEIRIFPTEEKREIPGRWSEEPEAVPAGGIPAQVVRELRLKDPIGLFEEFVGQWTAQLGAEATERIFERFGFTTTDVVRRRPGRAGRTDEFYATWAAAYVDRLQVGSRHPVKDLVLRPAMRIEPFGSNSAGPSEAGVRAIIHEARKRKLLTVAPKGRAGGVLTRKALRLIGSETP